MKKRVPAMGILYRIQDGLGQILGKACTGTLPGLEIRGCLWDNRPDANEETLKQLQRNR